MRNRRETMATGASSGGTTLISSETTVKGDITFTGQLDVEGTVVGSFRPGRATPCCASCRVAALRAKSKCLMQRLTAQSRATFIPVNDWSLPSRRRLTVTCITTLSRCLWALRSMVGCATPAMWPMISPQSERPRSPRPVRPAERHSRGSSSEIFSGTLCLRGISGTLVTTVSTVPPRVCEIFYERG